MLFTANLGLMAQTGQYVPELALFDSKMLDIISDHDIAGGQLAITYEGRLVYSRGFGYADTADQTLVEPNSIFRLASLSKSITGIAIMKLYENGVLNLDDRVLGVDGIFNDTMYQCAIDSRMYDFTVRQLLDHSSGFDFIFTNDPLYKTYDIAIAMGVPPPTFSFELVLQWTLQSDSLGFDPGTSAWYSNFGYTLLGLVIEKVSGMEYEDFVRDSIAIPLGITDIHAGRTLKEDKYPNEVSYHDYPGAPLATSIFTGIPNSVPAQYGGYNWEIITPAGGWVASAKDLCRMLVAVDRFVTKPDILLNETIEMMVQPSINWPAYSFGWFVGGNDYWNNGGIQGTATTFECNNTNEITFAILFNSLPYNYGPFYNDFVHLVGNEFSNIATWPGHDLFDTITSKVDAPKKSLIQIYPNPAGNFIYISGYDGQAEIINLYGFSVWKGEIIPGQKIDIAEFRHGVYFFKADKYIQKFIIGR